MNVIFDRLKAMYDAGTATDVTIHNAVIRGWITKEEYTLITGKEFVEEE